MFAYTVVYTRICVRDKNKNKNKNLLLTSVRTMIKFLLFFSVVTLIVFMSSSEIRLHFYFTFYGFNLHTTSIGS